MSNSATTVRIRSYTSSDAAETLQVFEDAIMVTASADYTSEQLAAWARPNTRDLHEWDRSMRTRESYVAVVGKHIAGFSDVSADGYIDMLFVSPQFARRGVARELLAHLEGRARAHSARLLSSHVSITARPLFEALGFRVMAEQHPTVEGVVMTNFRMTKELGTQA